MRNLIPALKVLAALFLFFPTLYASSEFVGMVEGLLLQHDLQWALMKHVYFGKEYVEIHVLLGLPMLVLPPCALLIMGLHGFDQILETPHRRLTAI